MIMFAMMIAPKIRNGLFSKVSSTTLSLMVASTVMEDSAIIVGVARRMNKMQGIINFFI